MGPLDLNSLLRDFNGNSDMGSSMMSWDVCWDTRYLKTQNPRCLPNSTLEKYGLVKGISITSIRYASAQQDNSGPTLDFSDFSAIGGWHLLPDLDFNVR